MWKISILFALIFSGCIATVRVPQRPACSHYVYKACAEFCPGPYRVTYRSPTTCFCECFYTWGELRKTAVIGTMGTVYK